MQINLARNGSYGGGPYLDVVVNQIRSVKFTLNTFSMLRLKYPDGSVTELL